MLNGHEWVERVALHEKVQIQKHSNCFAEGSDLRQIDAVASRLFAPDVFLGLARSASAGSIRRACVLA